jgi:hypothetical protein
LIVNYRVIRSAVLVIFGFLGFSLPVAAQQTTRGERSKSETAPRQLQRSRALDTPARLTLSGPDFSGAMHRSVLTEDLVMLTLVAGERLPAWNGSDGIAMPPLDYYQDDLPSAAEAKRISAAPVNGKDLPSEIAILPSSPLYYGGEVGFFYGRSSGKFEREIMQTYFLGTVGNDKFQITVGGAYAEDSVDVPRFRSGRSKH